MAAESPQSTPRTPITGHDQNEIRLTRDIMLGFNQFSPTVELIRLLGADDNDGHNDINRRLIFDFIQFRNLIAHAGTESMKISIKQMVCAFVIFCREILGIERTTHEPRSTENMSRTFARMADVNVLVRAEWFLNLFERGRIQKGQIARFLNAMVQNSSFSRFTFIVDEDDISVTYGGDIQFNETRFSYEWLKELEIQVHETSVTYTEDEIQTFVQLYNDLE